jgi:hypothetical protein
LFVVGLSMAKVELHKKMRVEEIIIKIRFMKAPVFLMMPIHSATAYKKSVIV